MGRIFTLQDVIEERAFQFSRRPGARFNRGRIASDVPAGTSPPPPPSFTPADVTSVPKVFWLRADLGVTVSTGVASWADQFGLNDAQQATPGNQPIQTLSDANFDGNASIACDGISKTLVFTGLDLPAPGTTPFQLYFVLRQTGWTSAAVLIGAQLNTLQLQQNTSSPGVRMNNGTGANLNNGAAINSTVIGSALFTGSVSDTLRLGASVTGGVSSGGANDPTLGNFTIGGRTAGTAAYCAVTFAEIIAYAGTPTEEAQIKTYLTTRYPTAAVWP